MNQIVDATYDHAVQLAPRLRAADAAEVRASNGLPVEDALVLSVALSANAKAWLVDGKVAALFGVAPTGRPGVGAPWMVGSDDVLKNKTFFLRQCRRYIHGFLEQFPVLTNYVDCRNIVAIQWLSWCGFALCEVEPFHGAQRLPFIRFQLARH
jgi:hypothetical protein